MLISGMRDFKYREAATAPIPHWGWKMTNFVESESLKPILEAFRWSMTRTSNFLHLPAWIALEATREQIFQDHSRVKCGGTINPDLRQHSSTIETPEMGEEFGRLARDFRNLSEDTIVDLFDDIGIAFIEHKLTNSRAVVEGLKAMYESVILDSWSAFEVLIRDLWVKVLDESQTIATKVYTSGVLRGAKKGIVATGDISKYGSLALELRQVSFQSYEDIETFYRAAFGEKPVDLFATVQDGYIRVLNAFRNVLMHNRGKLDLGFRNQIGKFTKFHVDMADGTEVPIDGTDVTKMRAAAMELGQELIQLADRALVGKPL